MTDQHSRRLLGRIRRLMAIRVARAYRTVSQEAAGLLAGIPPLELLAEGDAFVYERRHALRQGEAAPSGEEEEDPRLQSRRLIVRKWKSQLAPHVAHRVVGAILPIFDRWMDRGHGRLTFRLTQVLTGHGCFGEYLCRIGREPTVACHHCSAPRDTARHTLEECPAWDVPRRALVAEMGHDLSLPAVLRGMVGSEGSWRAVTTFCEVVMRRKEEAGREREQRDPARRRPAGAGRRH